MKAHFIIILFHLFLIWTFPIQAQMASISGFVKNQINGEAIANATVFESGSGIGTITNNDGFFRLILVPKQQRIEISSPDFNSFISTFNHSSDTVIVVELIPLDMPESNPHFRHEYQGKTYEPVITANESGDAKM